MTGAGRTPENYQIEDFVTDESFINYFFGLHAEDKTFWTKWLIANPEHAGRAEEAMELLRTLSLSLPEQEFEAELSRIQTAIHEDGQQNAAQDTRQDTRRRPAIFRFPRPEGNPGDNRGRTRKRKRSLVYISSLLLLVLASIFLWQHYNETGRMTEKTNDSGKPVVFTLSDGTVVTLAPQSILRYAADFGAGDRKVMLEGEAQFRVSKDGAHPFQVAEGGIVATVLGTVFHVKDQAADSAILVELITGKLKVETIFRTGGPGGPGGSPQSILLEPDERAVYRRNSQTLSKEKWQSQHDLPQGPNHLVFRKSNFEEIAARVKTVFGVTIINRSDKKDWRFTGNFVNTTAAEIAENMCLVEGLHSEVQGDTILIK